MRHTIHNGFLTVQYPLNTENNNKYSRWGKLPELISFHCITPEQTDIREVYSRIVCQTMLLATRTIVTDFVYVQSVRFSAFRFNTRTKTRAPLPDCPYR